MATGLLQERGQTGPVAPVAWQRDIVELKQLLHVDGVGEVIIRPFIPGMLQERSGHEGFIKVQVVLAGFSEDLLLPLGTVDVAPVYRQVQVTRYGGDRRCELQIPKSGEVSVQVGVEDGFPVKVTFERSQLALLFLGQQSRVGKPGRLGRSLGRGLLALVTCFAIHQVPVLVAGDFFKLFQELLRLRADVENVIGGAS